MKKIAIIALSFLTLGLCSCTKTYYEELNPQVVTIDVPQTSWNYSNEEDNNYFYATVDMPEITSTVFKNGLVKMYRTYDWNTSDAAQAELPYTRLNEWASDDNWYFYTETVDYEFSVGSMTIYYTASDFDYEIDEEFVPEAMSFRCVIY